MYDALQGVDLSLVFATSVHEPPRSLNPDEARVAPPMVSS